MDIFVRYFSTIFAVIVVFALLLLTTKFLAYKSKKMLKGNYMQIIESLSLGLNNRLHLIKVDKEFFVISASNKNIEFLARIDINDYEEEDIKNPISEVIDFKAVLKKHINVFNSRNQAKKVTEVEADNNVLRQSPKDAEKIQKSDLTFKENLEKLKTLNKNY